MLGVFPPNNLKVTQSLSWVKSMYQYIGKVITMLNSFQMLSDIWTQECKNRHGKMYRRQRHADGEFYGSGKVFGQTYIIFVAILSCLCRNKVNQGNDTLWN